jgi:peptidoglycan-associated lipoprotein
MRIKMLLLLGAMMTAQMSAQSNNLFALKPGQLDLAITCNPTVANVITNNGFTMQGGSVQVHGQFWRGLGVVADVSGLHTGNMHSSGVGLDLVTAVFGPRYTWQPAKHRYAVYGQFLVGEANGLHSIFPAAPGVADSADSMAWLAGGGMNIAVSRHLALRAFEADWLRTQLPNSTTNVQNNLRLGAGVIFKFK